MKEKRVYKRWTAAEDEWLRARYADAPVVEMLSRLGCTLAALRARAYALGLHRSAAPGEVRLSAMRRARMLYKNGMETRACWTLKPFTSTEKTVRLFMYRAGYILGDYKLGSERRAVFYDGGTSRKEGLERWAARHGFRVEALEG